MKNMYDVIIVGSGPAGIFAAIELTRYTNLRVLMLEKGKDLHLRKCPAIGRDISCPPCIPCGLVSGWGGAGAFSDGKLTLSSYIGGQLESYLGVKNTEELVRYVDDIYLRFGASNEVHGANAKLERLVHNAEKVGLRLVPMPVRHMGTERCLDVLKEMHRFLDKRIDSRTEMAATAIVVEDGIVKGVETEDDQQIHAPFVIVAPGREGADWLLKEVARLGLTVHNNPVDIGVRVEVPMLVLKSLTDVLYEVKLEYKSPTYRNRVRTFCMCPAGEVTMETTGGEDSVITVNGHSYFNRKTDNTNFALLVSANFTPPFKEPIAYGKNVARLANMISGGVLVQRWGDIKEGHRSKEQSIVENSVKPTLKSATPGDLSFVLPHRIMWSIIEMMNAMNLFVPGITSADTLLYGVEVKFYSARLELTKNLETEVKNMFAIGDGAGITRGLIQAAASGVVAAREIAQRLN